MLIIMSNRILNKKYFFDHKYIYSNYLAQDNSYFDFNGVIYNLPILYKNKELDISIYDLPIESNQIFKNDISGYNLVNKVTHKEINIWPENINLSLIKCPYSNKLKLQQYNPTLDYSLIFDNNNCLGRVQKGGEIVSIPTLTKCNKYFDDQGQNIMEINNSNCGYSLLTDNTINAFISSEDVRFYKHQGFDLLGIMRALYINLFYKNRTEGASTITQQLVKNLTQNTEIKLSRKWKEIKSAIELESHFTKREILEAYLASIYFGRNYYGICEAAFGYFGKYIADLTLSESAFLASMITSPNYYIKSNEIANIRKNEVLELMLKHQKINPDEFQLAKDNFVVLGNYVKREKLAGSEYFLKEVKKYVTEKYSQCDLNIHTFLNSEKQKKAFKLNKYVHQDSLGFVSQNKFCQVEALVGGKNYTDNNINTVTEIPRQIASLAKVFVYQAALESGMKPKNTFKDEKVYLNEDHGIFKHQIYNFYDGYLGKVTLDKAFKYSINTISIKLIKKLGIKKIQQIFSRYYIEAESDPLIALGLTETPLIDINHAYCLIHNNIDLVKPVFIKSIMQENKEGINILESFNYQHKPKMDTKIHNDLMSLLKRSDCKKIIYYKSGTTSDFRDLYAIGYDDISTTGNWIGHFDFKPVFSNLNSWDNINLLDIYKFSLDTQNKSLNKNEEAFLDTLAYMKNTFTPNGYYKKGNGSIYTCLTTEEPTIKNNLGRYQMDQKTWYKIKSKKNLTNFSPYNQDIAALELIYSKFNKNDIFNCNLEIFKLFDIGNSSKSIQQLQDYFYQRLDQLNNYYY